MKVDGERLFDFLRFWRRIPPTDQEPEEFSSEWVHSVQEDLLTSSDDVLDLALDEWKRLFEDDDDIRSSVNTRASGLLLVVGVVASVASLTSGAAEGAAAPFAVILVVLQVALSYFSAGTAWLAIRAQQVDTWTRPHIRPQELANSRATRVRRTLEVYVSVRRNRYTVEEKVGYLRAAQHFALATIILVGAVTAVATAVRATVSADAPGSIDADPERNAQPEPLATPPAQSSAPATPPVR